jgi:sialic acid synthase SpsE
LEVALGSQNNMVRPSEEENHLIARRSITASVDFKKGDLVSEGKIKIKRPALGIHPKYFAQVLGRKVNKDIPRDRWISWEDLADL